jgi:alkyl hydroperoxide reductase subunit AhpC
LTLAYPASTGKSFHPVFVSSRALSDSIQGRNFPELLRVIDSLQLGDKHKITTPANWKKGDE